MTDYQKELLQKMLEGRIKPWLETAKIVFWEQYENEKSGTITPYYWRWHDYNEAWKAYNETPLMKVMK